MKINFKNILFYCLSLCLFPQFSSCSSSDDTTEKEELGFITPTLEPNFESMKSSRLQVDVNSGKVNWTSNDQLLVFVHETGKQPSTEKEWEACKYQFVTNSTDCPNNKFTQASNSGKTLLLDPKKQYDWYVMYPYNETVTSPVGHGHYSLTSQTMDVADPTTHLGAVDIMGNVKRGVNAEQKISILLNHHATLMMFKVHNLTTEDFTPQYLEFETQSQTPAPISGDFSIDFEKGLTAKAGSNTMRLSLINSTTIHPNEWLGVTAMMAPFALNTNDQFNIRVVTDKSNTLQSSTMKKTIKFQAGTKSLANVKVTAEPISQDINPWETQGESEENIEVPV